MNTIKKLLPISLVILIFLSLSDVSLAQNSARKENLEAEKIAFFTKELSLSKPEAELFWPVYNDFSNRKDKINRDRKVLFQYISENKEYMTDTEVQESLDKFISYQTQETALIESFNKKFLDILPPKKVMMIYVTENQFKVYILKQIRDNRQIPQRDF
jgi:hypothetical protein